MSDETVSQEARAEVADLFARMRKGSGPKTTVIPSTHHVMNVKKGANVLVVQSKAPHITSLSSSVYKRHIPAQPPPSSRSHHNVIPPSNRGGRGGSGANNHHHREGKGNMSAGTQGKSLSVIVLAFIMALTGVGWMINSFYVANQELTPAGMIVNTQKKRAAALRQANEVYHSCLKQYSGISLSIPSSTGAAPPIHISEPGTDCGRAYTASLNFIEKL